MPSRALKQASMHFMLGAAALALVACSGDAPTSAAGAPRLLAETTSTTLTLTGTRSAYRIRLDGDAVLVTDANNVTTTYRGLQNIRFSDVTVNLAVGAQALRIAEKDLNLLVELYIAFFNRVPDGEGLAYWIGRFIEGRSIEQIAEDFYGSAVYFGSVTDYSANMTNADFVRIIYKNVLGRSGATAPPDEDVNYWAGRLANGQDTRGSLVKTMLESAHTFKGHATWGWVADLLDNKGSVGRSFAVENGLGYLTSEDSITKGMAIAGAVTPTGTKAATDRFPVTESGFSLVTQARTSAMPGYGATVLRTTTDVPPVTPIPSVRSVGKQYFFHYDKPRAIALVDINNDGLDDMVFAPSLFDQQPALPIELWLNRGNGKFENATSALIDGAVPVTGSVNNIFVADFNRDGIPDIFLVDQGLEDKDCSVAPGCPGGRNILLMSQPNGKLKDVTATALAGDVGGFNHVSSMGDVNGDGLPDIVVARLGGHTLEGEGVLVYLNRGDGSFTRETTSLLPDEIAYMPSSTYYSPAFEAAHPAPFSRQFAGSTAVGDLDGDGANEIVSCSYAQADSRINTRTVRIFKRASGGKYAEAARLEIPAAIKGDADMGCSGLVIADIDGDGRADLLVNWENRLGNGVKAALLRNLGGLGFADITETALGGYAINFTSNGFNFNPLTYALRDVNGDGLPDIIYGAAGVTAQHLSAGMPTAFINLGNGRFTKQLLKLDGATLSTTQAQAISACDYCAYLPLYGRLEKKAAGDKKLDLLLLSTSQYATQGQYMQEAKLAFYGLLAR